MLASHLACTRLTLNHSLLISLWPMAGTVGQSSDYFKSTDENRGFREEYTTRAKKQVSVSGYWCAAGGRSVRGAWSGTLCLIFNVFLLSLVLSLLQDSHLDYISTGLDRLKHIAEDMAQVRAFCAENVPLLLGIYYELPEELELIFRRLAAIGQELDNQAPVLDHMEDQMTEATTQLRNNNKRMAELILEVWPCRHCLPLPASGMFI